MKTEDFERLKAVCEKEGFEISIANRSLKDVFEIHKKDPWEGVEFIEFIDTDLKGKIYKIQSIDSNIIYLDRDYKFGNTYARCHKEMVKPSTEQAYVDQLKKEAFERFGEIKRWDRFKLNDSISEITDMGITSWIYRKETDAFGKHGVVLYQQGKWAELVKERVEVSPINMVLSQREGNIDVDFIFRISVKEPKLNGCQLFLAQQLEKYLNNELE